MATSKARGSDPRGDDRADRGRGTLRDYTYTLVPRFPSTTIRLAASDPCAAEIAEVLAASTGPLEAFVERRHPAEDRVDAPMAVRIHLGDELSGVVGYIPRGLEAVPQELLSRIARRGGRERIPAMVVRTRYGLRVDLLVGRVR